MRYQEVSFAKQYNLCNGDMILQLQQVLVKHNPNTVIFGMLDKEFVFVNKEQTRVKNMVKKVSSD